jgi:hypothetical protein
VKTEMIDEWKNERPEQESYKLYDLVPEIDMVLFAKQ